MIAETNNVLFTNDFVDVTHYEEENAFLCHIKTPAVPTKVFVSTLVKIGVLVELEQVSRFILDLSAMVVCDDQAMEWLYVEWSEKMFTANLRKVSILLPENNLFKQQLVRARKEMVSKHPDKDIHRYNIRYARSVNEALLVS